MLVAPFDIFICVLFGYCLGILYSKIKRACRRLGTIYYSREYDTVMFEMKNESIKEAIKRVKKLDIYR